ncbi:MAG: hypothetical protein KC777_15235 [Cyanobacteria bacterium HKST-UBA02]|nr:hypothetical protein [Cyanobacteria bacterium HKST-UBA02]
MRRINEEFEAALERQALKRGFNKGRRELSSTPIYSTSEWLIGTAITVGFPDVTLRLLFTPQNPPPDRSRQHLIACDALWCPKQEKWLVQDRAFDHEELISLAFEQIEQ